MKPKRINITNSSFRTAELDDNLSQQIIRQLKERITYSFNLAPLQEYEVRDYINTRMRMSGYQGMDLFNRRAVKVVSKHSQGLLRRINIIADKACLAAYAQMIKWSHQNTSKLLLMIGVYGNARS